jgi:isopenicillin N synthase-like dioxygenase
MTEAPEPGQLRLGAHTDYGSLTLLYQDETPGGLQVHRDGVWRDAPIVPGTFVVNIGDLMSRWTNDRWVSTLHRVQNPAQGRWDVPRLSIPYFHQPNYDAVIEAIPTCVAPGEQATYPPITSGDNLTYKTRSTLDG